VINANEAAIEAAGVVLHSYTAPGKGHGILEWPRFYEMEVNGECADTKRTHQKRHARRLANPSHEDRADLQEKPRRE